MRLLVINISSSSRATNKLCRLRSISTMLITTGGHSVIAENTMSKSKIVFEMTAAGLDGHRETTTPLMHSGCNDGAIQLSPLSSYAVLEVVRRDQSRMFYTPCLAVFPTHFSQLGLTPANLESTIESDSFFFQKRHLSMTSQLRHHYVLSCKY